MLSQRPESSGPGWVYVLICPDFPGCCKIGGTGRTATHRAAELVITYGTTSAFAVVDRHAVADWWAVEQATHRMLSDRRLPRSELFQCTPAEASRVIQAAAAAYARPWAGTAWLRRMLFLPYLPPRFAARARRTRWGYRRRGSNDGRAVLLVVVVIAAWLVIWKPSLPTWLPPPLTQVVMMLERLQFVRP
jgi:hypothetical protein